MITSNWKKTFVLYGSYSALKVKMLVNRVHSRFQSFHFVFKQEQLKEK